jgi:hypothetical protein
MPKAHVCTTNGEHCTIEADGFQLLAESGFVLLKRRGKEVPPGHTAAPEQTVAIFYRPDKVVLELPENVTGAQEGSFT